MHALLIPMLLALCVALCVGFLIAGLGSWAATVPPAAKSSERPPPFWRWMAWPINAASFTVRPFVDARMRAALQQQLRQAGLDYALTPDQVVGARVVAALLGAALAFIALPPSGRVSFIVVLACALTGWVLPGSWLRDRVARRMRQINRSLPFFLDIITLALEAGSNMTGALQHATEKGPEGPMADEFQRVLRDIRAGRNRADALRMFGERLKTPAITNWVAAVLSAERQGTSLGPILRAQSEQRRQERFLRAEAMALKAPVKMLFPLVFCIFPCTFVIVFFPIVVQVIHEGILQ